MVRKMTFTSLADGTREDYQALAKVEHAVHARIAGDVLDLFKSIASSENGYALDPYRHSLQTATRAVRDGADEEAVVVALLHDMGDRISPDNHGEVAASVLRPFISENHYWLLQHHPIFQGYFYWHHLDKDRNAREKFRGHPAFQLTANFCERWDSVSFDPAYDTMTVEEFEPMVRRILSREPFANRRAA